MKQKRIWRDVLRSLTVKGAPAAFSSADIAEAFHLSPENAAQLLARLKGWGHIRPVGFRNNPSGMGRRATLFEVTKRGRAAAVWTGVAK